MMELRFELDKLPDVKAEPLTNSEKRIFLAAMGRERGICEKVDAETRDMNDPEAVNLVRVCDNIEKKVRAALWTEPAVSFPQAHENDLISRQAAIDRAVPLEAFGKTVMIVAVSEIERLPSA